MAFYAVMLSRDSFATRVHESSRLESMRSDDVLSTESLLIQTRSAESQLRLTRDTLGHTTASNEVEQVPAAWSERLVEDVLNKLYYVFNNPSSVASAWERMHGEYECQKVRPGRDVHPSCSGLTSAIRPDAPKFLRLGFHDCVPYKNSPGGCDACLNLRGVFTKYDMAFLKDKDNSLDEGVSEAGDNNNLGLTADILEQIYTDRDFPKGATVLQKSLAKGGQSRADLWALATLAAAQYGMEANNKICSGHNKNVARGLGRQDQCLIKPSRSFVFRWGRRDCDAATKPPLDDNSTFYRRRAYETLDMEQLPSSHANGRTVQQYFEEHFDFSARETVAIMGAHSFGKFHSDTSLFKYDWTRGTKNMMNNEYYRIIALRPHLNKQTKPSWNLVGGPGRSPTNSTGALAKTRWLIRAHKFTAGGGPFQWSHQYKRCPYCLWNDQLGEWEVKEPSNGGSQSFRSVYCCKECEKSPGDSTIDPKCFTWISQDEEALATDAGLYVDFDVDSESGRPLGCSAFRPKSEPWKDEYVDPTNRWHLCPKQAHKNMSNIVEEYADDQNKWAGDFIASLEKMLSRGSFQLSETGFTFPALS